MKLSDAQLTELLQRARLPERPPEYWDEFPKRVLARLAAEGARPAAPRRGFNPRARRWLGAAALAAACLVVTLSLWMRARMPAPTDYARLYREIAAEFPHQLQAIIADEKGIRVLLADHATMRDDLPLWVEAVRPGHRRWIITFSGQQLPINGDVWDVLLNAQDEVFVAGHTTDQYHILAGTL